MAGIKSPFNVGDKVEFVRTVSKQSHRKGTRCTITAIGYEHWDNRTGKAPWRVKISLERNGDWWSAAWFKKVK